MSKTERVRIRHGAIVFHDFMIGRWPTCKPPKSEYPEGLYKTEASDPDMVFDGEWIENYWKCTAPGYGHEEDYGCGAILVKAGDSVIPVVEDEEEDLRDMLRKIGRRFGMGSFRQILPAVEELQECADELYVSERLILELGEARYAAAVYWDNNFLGTSTPGAYRRPMGVDLGYSKLTQAVTTAENAIREHGEKLRLKLRGEPLQSETGEDPRKGQVGTVEYYQMLLEQSEARETKLKDMLTFPRETSEGNNAGWIVSVKTLNDMRRILDHRLGGFKAYPTAQIEHMLLAVEDLFKEQLEKP